MKNIYNQLTYQKSLINPIIKSLVLLNMIKYEAKEAIQCG